ncbi:MAG: hypothetical protein A2474_07065, partial [Elusimicrobia bacterium RIFOXYC2_FULL_34_12]
MKCIYCLNEKDDKFFKSVEHVIPQAFGVFENNFTLKNMVCDCCNQNFGNTIDIVYARDSYEGIILRFISGIKNQNEFKTFGKNSKIEIRLKEGPFKGAYAYLKYNEEESDILLDPIPQVGFLKIDNEYDYFKLDEIPNRNEIDEKKYKINDPEFFYIFIEHDKLFNELKNKGYTPKIIGEKIETNEQKQRIQVNFRWSIENTSFRAVSKIAFNYLAYWQGADFVLKNDFDIIRKYILNGTKVDYPLVKISTKPILKNDLSSHRIICHVLTLNWALDKRSIVAQVTMCNQIVYSICLSKNFSGIWQNIRK